MRIRQALNLALNRDELVGELLYGYGVPAKGAILQYNTQWFNDDPDQQLHTTRKQPRRSCRKRPVASA